MDKNKKYGVIDIFTVFYCIMSAALTFFVLGLIGVDTFNIAHGILISVTAPFTLDILLTIIIWVVVVVHKMCLKVKKWRHDKKNPPINF